MKNEISTTKKHSTLLMILSVACFGAVAESVLEQWEFWVPPLMVFCLAVGWILHVRQSGHETHRENYYLLYAMLMFFFHGVHQTSFFDVLAASAMYMVLIAMLKRPDFLRYALVEFFVLFVMHIIWAIRTSYIDFDSLDISRIFFHVAAEICIYHVLKNVIFESLQANSEIERRDALKLSDQVAMEDFLVNISHELRTPVNVINGISGIILKKENREDVRSIRDAASRLSLQIENIQDYSEIQRGSVIAENEPYRIVSLWEDLLENFDLYNQKGKPELTLDLDPLLPVMMRGDVKKLQKIIRHLLDNSFKFTNHGGVYVKISGIQRDYGMNLIIEVCDTGCGMSAFDKENVSKGVYQANQKRNRTTGGIGLGLSVVYGFARCMDGFVSIESEKGHGTTVRVSVAQEVMDATPWLTLHAEPKPRIAFYMIPAKFKIRKLREFYTNTATNLAKGLNVKLYSVSSLPELKTMLKEEGITYVFMGEEEYFASPSYFDELANGDVTVVVSASKNFTVNRGSKVVVMPKPLYGASVVKVLSDKKEEEALPKDSGDAGLKLDGIRALIVDDEPMNLVVASNALKEYNMEVDAADSGREAVLKYTKKDYDIVFMDYMMPEMDGIEAVKRMRFVAEQKKKKLFAVAISANAVSGARDLFLNNGFDGYIPKPIQIAEFKRVMQHLLNLGLTSPKEVE